MIANRPHAQHHVYLRNLPAHDDSPGAFPLPPKPGSAEMTTVRPSSLPGCGVSACCSRSSEGSATGFIVNENLTSFPRRCAVGHHSRGVSQHMTFSSQFES